MKLEAVLAPVLATGTWLASGLIAIGLFFRPSIVAAGIALFISLPALRVLVMLGAYIGHRDRYGIVIAALVLSIIAFGVAIGATG